MIGTHVCALVFDDGSPNGLLQWFWVANDGFDPPDPRTLTRDQFHGPFPTEQAAADDADRTVRDWLGNMEIKERPGWPEKPHRTPQ